MKLRTLILVLSVIFIFNSCKNHKKTELIKIDTIQHPWDKNLTPNDAKRLIDSVTKNITDNDIILYKGDKGFYIDEANKAQKFVVKVLQLESINKENISCGYFPVDSSYLVEFDRILNKDKMVSSFYRYYPKRKIILNGVTFDTVYQK